MAVIRGLGIGHAEAAILVNENAVDLSRPLDVRVVAEDDIRKARVETVREVDELAKRLAGVEAAYALVGYDDGHVRNLGRLLRGLVCGGDAGGHFDVAEAARRDHARSFFVRDADHCDRDAADVVQAPGLNMVEVTMFLQVGRHIVERRAGAAGSGRLAGHVDHRLEVADAAVEVMVAQGSDLYAHHALGEDRRNFVEEARQRGRGAEVIASGQRQRRIRQAILLPSRGEVPGATDATDRIKISVPVGHVQ